MNKQEVISKLKSAIPKNNIDDYQRGEAAGLNFALLLLAELDEPEKPVLTKAEAEWVEGLKEEQERRPFWTKYSALYFITRCGFGYGFSYDHNGREIELKHYPHETHVEKERLANAILYGYEVEKEKLYTVEVPNPNSAGGKLVLSKQQSTGRLILEMLNSGINKPKYLHLTESEIKQDFEWAWQFAEEVE